MTIHWIQIKLRGLSMDRTIMRIFHTSKLANQYLNHFFEDDKIIDHNPDYTSVDFESGIQLGSNYSYKKITEGIEPEGLMPDISDPHKYSPERPRPAAPKVEDQISIRELCDHYKIRPHDARTKLRKSKEYRGHKGKWVFDKDEVEKVGEIICS